ncbi:hypothetical protein Hanom_Chr07g00635421 [Helianthus anomalus]
MMVVLEAAVVVTVVVYDEGGDGVHFVLFCLGIVSAYVQSLAVFDC